MSEEQNVSNIEQNEGQSTESSESVDYNSYKKLLNQRKNDKTKMAEMAAAIDELKGNLGTFKQKEEEIKQSKLEEEQKYKELKDVYANKLKAMEEAEQQRKQQEIAQQKTELFMKELPGDLRHQDYLKLANLDGIAVHPDQGIIDELSVKEVVDEFVKSHPHLINMPTEEKPLPSESPKSGVKAGLPDISNMSRDQLKDLLNKLS